MNRRCERQGGFTLLEVMVAVLIAGVILVTIYGSVSRTMNSKDFAEERGELYATGRDAVLRVSGEIEGALPPPSGDRILFRGQSGGDQTPAGTVEFVAVNRGGYGANRIRPGQVYIAYSVDPLPHLRNTFALRREEHLFAKLLADADGVEWPGDEDEAPTQSASYLLDCPQLPNEIRLPGNCTRVAGLRFRFYDDWAGNWREEWDTTQEGPDQNRLPAAVEVTLFLADESGGIHDFSTIVDLPLAREQPTPGPDSGQQPTEEEQGTEGQDEE